MEGKLEWSPNKLKERLQEQIVSKCSHETAIEQNKTLYYGFSFATELNLCPSKLQKTHSLVLMGSVLVMNQIHHKSIPAQLIF